jgi:hypothetical protein
MGLLGNGSETGSKQISSASEDDDDPFDREK